MKIIHIKHKEINKAIWDKRITNSKHSTIYAFSWFLDIVSPNWEAVVSDDYEFIMPLPKSSKYYINYIKRPIQLQKIGIISDTNITDEIAETFINAIHRKYKIIDIPLFNKFNFKLENGFIRKRTNYELNLNNSYEDLYKGYSQNHKKNLRKAYKNNLTITKFYDINLYLDLRKKDEKFYLYESFAEEYLTKLRQILEYAEKQNIGGMYFVQNSNNEYIASVFFLFKDNIATKFSINSTTEGKNLRASFIMMDNFIKNHSNKNLILDFVGSDIKGIAFFNKGFGAKINEYTQVYINRLKFPFNLLKK